MNLHDTNDPTEPVSPLGLPVSKVPVETEGLIHLLLDLPGGSQVWVERGVGGAVVVRVPQEVLERTLRRKTFQ